MLRNAPWKELHEVLLYGDHFKTELTQRSKPLPSEDRSVEVDIQQLDWKMKFCDYTKKTIEVNTEIIIFP